MLCVTMTTAAIEPVEEPIEPVTIIEEAPPLVEKPPLELGKDYFFWDYEDRVEFIEPVKMRVTCYLPTGNLTASGTRPHYGGCAAKREWMGGVAVLYTLEGEYIGVWEIDDTGGHTRITSGQSVDLFMETEADARNWIAEYGDYLLVQILPDAKG